MHILCFCLDNDAPPRMHGEHVAINRMLLAGWQVYGLLGDEFQQGLHALSMTTKAPGEQ